MRAAPTASPALPPVKRLAPYAVSLGLTPTLASVREKLVASLASLRAEIARNTV